MTPEQQIKDDMIQLMGLAPFRRFLFRAIQSAGIFDPATDGSEGRNLAEAEGRRNLGFMILDDAAQAQPLDHEAARLMTFFLILREESQKPAKEPKRGRRYDRYAELNDGSDDDRDDANGD